MFWSSFYKFDSNFSGIKEFGLIYYMILMKEVVFLTMLAGNKKKTLLAPVSKQWLLREKNALLKTFTTEKLCRLDKEEKKWREKCCNRKNLHFDKKDLKVKEHIDFRFHDFHNFALKIETSWAKRVIKLILETKTMLIYMVTHSRIKN